MRGVVQLVAHKKVRFLDILFLPLTASLSIFCEFMTFFDISIICNKSHQNHTKSFSIVFT